MGTTMPILVKLSLDYLLIYYKNAERTQGFEFPFKALPPLI